MIKIIPTLLIGIWLIVGCGQTNNNSLNNVADSIKNKTAKELKVSSLKINESISTKDLLDTNLYNRIYPPGELITENLTDAPLIAEGIFLQVDSIGDTWEKIVTFQIDTMWKGKIADKAIKFITFNDDTLEEYKKNSYKVKKIVFLKKFEKEKIYDYIDSIEYSPIREFAIFTLDRDFKDYLLKEHKQIKKIKN